MARVDPVRERESGERREVDLTGGIGPSAVEEGSRHTVSVLKANGPWAGSGSRPDSVRWPFSFFFCSFLFLF
jgi:hypothetical protein